MASSKEGASPDSMKVEAIKQAEPPRNAKELNSFLCTVQYNARFMESYAPQTDFLKAPVRAEVFKWEEKHQEAFEALKNALSADTVLRTLILPLIMKYMLMAVPWGSQRR